MASTDTTDDKISNLGLDIHNYASRGLWRACINSLPLEKHMLVINIGIKKEEFHEFDIIGAKGMELDSVYTRTLMKAEN